MLRIIRNLVTYLVLLATLAASLYLFVTGNNWGGFGTGLILVLETLALGLGAAVVREFGENIIEDTKREHYTRGYRDGLKEALKKGVERRG